MGTRLVVAAAVAGCAGLAACAGIRPSQAVRGPAPPPAAAACSTRDYGTVTFQNQSRTTTQTVMVNGVKACVLPPGYSQNVNLAAGVTHAVTFYVANTGTIACGRTPLTLAACQTRLFYCAYP